MTLKTETFNYHLPEEQIAQKSAHPRDRSRLLVLDRKTGERKHTHFYDFPTFLNKGDLLVFNDTKVFKARLLAKRQMKHNRRIKEGVFQEHELFLLAHVKDENNTSVWRALVKRVRRVGDGDVLSVHGLNMRVMPGEIDETGEREVVFAGTKEDVLHACDQFGEIPIPPYVTESKTLDEYQTLYAKKTGSVAAPTSGFHFTEKTFKDLRAQGVQVAFVTLHVGLGTFMPVKTDDLLDHPIHAEYAEVSEEVCKQIQETKQAGARVVAVGTTVVRTLEGVATAQTGLKPYAGDVNLFIYPGFPFQVVDALLTNFHLPKSTLLALVSGFAGTSHVLAAYKEAVQKGYRFFSFGDAMFIK